VASNQDHVCCTLKPKSMEEISHDIEAMHSSMSPNLAKELNLQMQKASNPINVYFAKDKLYNIKEVALDVIVERKKLEFRKSFTLCKMDEVDLILNDTRLEPPSKARY
jgi:hypothetical protein